MPQGLFNSPMSKEISYSTKYIQGRLLPDLTAMIKEKLGTKDGWKIIVDPDDAQTLLFY
jgi:hypothetical protein